MEYPRENDLVISEALREGLYAIAIAIAIAIAERPQWLPHLKDIPHPDRSTVALKSVRLMMSRYKLNQPASLAAST